MCTQNTTTALHTGTVAVNEMVGDELWRMAIRVEDWQGPIPEPGQFIMLRVADGGEPLLARPFGVAGFEISDNRAHLEIIYRVVGRGTAMMAKLKDDTAVSFLGPLGRAFRAAPENTKCILVAGGVGLPPLLYLARVMVEDGRGSDLTLIYGETTRERLLDLDHRIIPAIEVVVCTDDGSCGQQGLVTDQLSAKLNGADLAIFTCGPNPMMAAIYAMTGESGLNVQFSLEARMACGFGVCSGCAVMTASGTYERVCVEGPVFSGDQLVPESFG
jgi:dihydroorotate dehydrogenase electron transfer subunit